MKGNMLNNCWSWDWKKEEGRGETSNIASKINQRWKLVVLQSRLSFFLRSGSSQLVFLKYPSTRNSCMTSWWGKALPRARIVAFPGFTIFGKPSFGSSSLPIFSSLKRYWIYSLGRLYRNCFTCKGVLMVCYSLYIFIYIFSVLLQAQFFRASLKGVVDYSFLLRKMRKVSLLLYWERVVEK